MSICTLCLSVKVFELTVLMRTMLGTGDDR